MGADLSGLGGALRAPLGPVVAPLVPRYALLPAPTPRMMGVRPDEASFIQRVRFPHRQGPASQRESSLALCEVTNMAKRRQSDRQAPTKVKRNEPRKCDEADADRVPVREGNSRRGLWRLRRRICRGRSAEHAGKGMDGGTGEAHRGLSR